jgi:hypothetical protein
MDDLTLPTSTCVLTRRRVTDRQAPLITRRGEYKRQVAGDFRANRNSRNI